MVQFLATLRPRRKPSITKDISLHKTMQHLIPQIICSSFFKHSEWNLILTTTQWTKMPGATANCYNTDHCSACHHMLVWKHSDAWQPLNKSPCRKNVTYRQTLGMFSIHLRVCMKKMCIGMLTIILKWNIITSKGVSIPRARLPGRHIVQWCIILRTSRK
jgi:hypothetical protein